MATLYVLQTGRTTWEDLGRIESAAGAPLSEAGATQVAETARELISRNITAVFAGDGEAEKQTAQAVADELSVKVHTQGEIREFDYGLWQGLTIDEVRRRQPKVYRQWMDTPDSVCPPGGETLDEALKRIRRAVKRIVKRQKDGAVLLVLRPVVLGLLRGYLAGDEPAALWQHVDPNFTWASYDTDEAAL